MSISRMKTAVIGCGMISDIYLKNMIERFEILDVVGCCCTSLEKAQRKAAEYGIRGMTLREILDDPEIETVVNLTPPLQHGHLIRESLEAGKHVYTEKVITPYADESIALNELAASKGLRLGCAPDTFLGAAIQTAKLAIERGMIGEVTSVSAWVNRDYSASYKPAFVREAGGGVGVDVGIYYLTAILSILGPVEKACGFTVTRDRQKLVTDPRMEEFGTWLPVDNESCMTASLKFCSGVLGTLHFNSDCIWPEVPGITFYGREGILTLPDPNRFGGPVLLRKKGMAEPVELPVSHGFANNSRGVGVAEMAWAIRNDRPHRANGDMGSHAVEVFEGIIRSSEDGMTHTMRSSFAVLPGLPEGYPDNYNKNPEWSLVNMEW